MSYEPENDTTLQCLELLADTFDTIPAHRAYTLNQTFLHPAIILAFA